MEARAESCSPILENLNEQQKSALLGSFKNDSIVLASPGSGKTSLLTKRIEYLIDEKNTPPSSIIAFTFTNKAANVLKERIAKLTNNSNEMWIGTYHSICVKILRMFGEQIGFDNFTILDTSDAKKVASEIICNMGMIYTNELLEEYMKSMSMLKNKMISPKLYRDKVLPVIQHKTDKELLFVDFYSLYQKENIKNQTLDFDDLIYYTIFILENVPASMEYVRSRFRYIHADEVQDSNDCNMHLLKLLSMYCNLFIIGDEDQSIYRFRGANPALLKGLNYRKFKLERNYRSTQTIVNAANSLIIKNKDRTDKTCFSLKDAGETIRVCGVRNEYEEAQYIASKCKWLVDNKKYKYEDIYILYRTNKQAEVIEKALSKGRVPYRMAKGISFAQRKEIQECLAFLKLTINKKDKHSFKRALGTLEGVGEKTIQSLLQELEEKGDVLEVLKHYKTTNKTVAKSLQMLYNYINIYDNKPYDVLKPIVNHVNMSQSGKDQSLVARHGNMVFLLEMAEEAQIENRDIQDFVYGFDLLTPTDDVKKENLATLMTIHSSKGLENKVVFIAGCCEGLLPHFKSSSEKDIEEERRLFYVAMTRAEELLYLTYFTWSKANNKAMNSSRYIKEIGDKFKRRI